MHDPPAVLAKAFAWLKPGGILTLTLPNVDSLEASLFGRYWFGLDLPRHLWQFTPRSLSQMASGAGYEVLEVETTRSCYIENSVRNVWKAVRWRSMAGQGSPRRRETLAWPAELLRKAFRLSTVYPFRALAVALGAGADIHAAFRKPQ
jgi:hypothetical protein